jgi:hypothetical protein
MKQAMGLEWPVGIKCLAQYGVHRLFTGSDFLPGMEAGLFSPGNDFKKDGRRRFQINTYEIAVPNLPPSFNEFTIVQLTDIHFGFLMPLRVVKKLLNKANSIKRDMIVCTGDYVHQRSNAGQIDIVCRKSRF